MQKLILPINKAKLTASWKTQAYLNRFKFQHYGIDMVSTQGTVNLYASGDGVVVNIGRDSIVGNVIAIKYIDAYNTITKKYEDVIFRYFHLNRIDVKVNQKTTKDTIIGAYGNTGSLSMAQHLHLEADTDTANPLFSPTVKNSSLLRGSALGANDITMTTPLEWLHCKVSAPDNQSYITAQDDYCTIIDRKITIIE